jgi:transposase
VLLYGYCLGVRSSRQLERRCHEDLAFRVLAANQTPDHVTIARFRARHERALAGFLVESLKLGAQGGGDPPADDRSAVGVDDERA